MARPLAEVYRRFGESTDTSPLYGRVAVAISGSDAALRAVEKAPARRRHPAVILAALHALALDGQAPELAAAFAAGEGPAAAIDTLLGRGDAVAAVAARRLPQTFATQRVTVLHPAVAEAAHRAGASAVGLIDVGRSAGLNLHVDRVGVTYDNGQVLGDPSSPVQLSSSVVGDRRIPARAVPEVVVRIGVDPDPVDVTDADDARWLRACLEPGLPERAARLDAEIALAAADPPLLLRGDAVGMLAEAVERVPAGALPVITTTWALSGLRPEARLRFRRRLDELATGRALAWVSLEGVGVAPSVPTLGDRPASGHSLTGVTVLGPAAAPRVEVVGRCWSRGRLLSWLADA